MVIVLIRARNLRDLLKTQVVRIRLWEGEYHVDEVLAQTGEIGDTLAWCGNADHGFRRMKGNCAHGAKGGNKMIKQGDGVRRLSAEEITQCFVVRVIWLFHKEAR